MRCNYLAAEVKDEGSIVTLVTFGTFGNALRYAKGAFTGSVISGWDICDIWDMGPQRADTFYDG